MKRLLLSSLLALCIAVSANAQDFPYAKFASEEMEMKQYNKDTSAHAVVLNEFGKTEIIGGNDKVFLLHQYHVKIKIFDAKGFENGNIEIPIYKSDNDRFEEVRDVSGITFYKDDNGLIQKVELDEKKVFTVNENKHWNTLKFAMPNLRNGCIIEYKYTLESPYFFNFRQWDFQSKIPKIYSEYEAHIPAIYNYNVSLRGFQKLTKNKADLERECFSFYGTKCDCSKITYAMQDVPAFIEEDYMTSAKNFLSAIYFELSDYVSLNNGSKVKVTKEWKDIDYELKHDQSFGSQLNRRELMKDRLAGVLNASSDTLAKAKTVYAFIQKNFKWNKFNTIYSEDGLRKALDNHTGNVAEINLSLIAGLNAAGIPAEAVLLSTREHGLINKLYPVVSDFNYVVARITIGGKTYMLDATDPLLPFGLLPVKCINDQGRVMPLNKPSYWVDMVAPQKEGSTYLLDLTLEDNGKIKGTISRLSTGYEAYRKRIEIKKFNSVDEYVDNINLNKIKIIKSDITNLDSLDLPLSEKYEIEINAYSGTDHSRLAFNPYLIGRMVSNPFKLVQRTYPVDRGMPSDERYILNMHLPSQYTVEAPPQEVGIAMPNSGGKYITSFQIRDDGFAFSNVLQLNKSIYSVEEYPYLKELFNKIIQVQKADLVFKKKS